MSNRREALVHAAISVLATGGSRALTHRAVDAAADVPAGAASNCFRTRSDLLAGVLEEVLTAEIDHYGRLPERPGPDGLAHDVAAMIEHLTGPARATTLARLALALEASWNPDLAVLVDRGRGAWREIAVVRLRALGVADAQAAADGLLALVDGFVLDRVRGGATPTSDPELVARALLRGLTAGTADPLPEERRRARPTPTPG